MGHHLPLESEVGEAVANLNLHRQGRRQGDFWFLCGSGVGLPLLELRGLPPHNDVIRPRQQHRGPSTGPKGREGGVGPYRIVGAMLLAELADFAGERLMTVGCSCGAFMLGDPGRGDAVGGFVGLLSSAGWVAQGDVRRRLPSAPMPGTAVGPGRIYRCGRKSGLR